MKRTIITTPNCIECKSKKMKWDANGIKYNEVEANSEEGQKLIAEFGITRGGTVLDLDKGIILEDK